MKTIRFGFRTALAALLLASIVPPVFALNLEGTGMTLVSATRQGGQYVYELQSADGVRLTVLSDAEVTDEQTQRVAYLYKTIMTWGWMTSPALRVTVADRKAEALVVPARFTWQNQDLARYLPSGMQFYLDNILEYDFRMKVGTLFLRVRGQFFDAAELSTLIADAAKDPAGFLQRTDPQYLFRTLQETTSVIQQLGGEGTNAMENVRELVRTYQTLKDERPLIAAKLDELSAAIRKINDTIEDLTAQAKTLLEESMAALKTQLETAASDFTTRQDELREQVQALQTQMAAQIETTRQGVLAAGNAGLFSGPRAMDPKMVARVVELRSGNAAITTEQILSTLKTEGIKATKNQVNLIVLTYFGPGT